VDVNGGVEGVELAFVEVEVRGCEIADVDGARAVTGKLMS
jgi:hypothetical protein